ncbi:hypothetical protein HUW48_17800 [Adhaeribacter radiodurans]|uniref:Uncharacterized protein n=1 Tax=Adhaeribacter radiodurans TaxID=2745197 RepID=A0A7L7LA90_9BACT|nr:hypothetical protein [Adhaeribacter radiodurans]QMU29762.1 hypothetical protein HUW48_17800 [Adhaeribacter radiodurans]
MRDNLLDNDQKAHYILIDDLDKEWAAPQIVYDLIAAMIEVIKEFQVFKGAKIIIALRENLNQLVFSGHQHRGGQREKFAALYLPLEWDKASLTELINKRLKFLTQNSLEYKSAFEKEGKGGESGFNYVLDRTYLRPRDVISFVNKIINNAHTKSSFSKNVIKHAEPEYSIERLHAIDDEWSENYGFISKASSFLIGKYNGFRIQNLKEDDFYDVYCEEDYSNIFKGDLLNILVSWKINKIKFKNFIKEFLYIMFRVGVIGIKKSATEPIRFFYNNDIPVASADFAPEVRIYVHKALYSALKINVKALEADYLD